MTTARLAIIVGLAAAVLSPAAGAAPSRSTAVVVRLPSAGEVSVARLTVQGSPGIGAALRVSVVNKGAVARRAVVVATVARTSGRARFLVTITAIAVPPAGQAAAPTAPETAAVAIPASFRVVAGLQSVHDVLYQNTPPPFPLATGGTSVVIAGEAPGKLPAAQVARDGQLLAFDRGVPLADLQVIGLEHVTLQLPVAKTNVRATVGLANLGQVNGIQLRLPAGVRVVRAAGPEGTTTAILPDGSVQLLASSAFFQEGLQYSFALELSRPLRRGESVILRASTHYFESSLPFTERFVLS